MFTSEHGNVSTQIRQNYSSIFNPKPTGLNQSSTFSMALPLRPYHLPRFIHQKLHANRTSMFKHLYSEAHRTKSVVEIQHGSSPQAFNVKPTGPDQPLRFSMALPLRLYLPCRFIHQRLQPNRIVNAKLTGSDQPLRFGMALPLRPSM